MGIFSNTQSNMLFVLLIASIAIIIINKINYTKKYNNLINEAKKAVEDAIASIPKLNSMDRIQFTGRFLEFINQLISIEIVNTKKFDIFLNREGKNIDVDAVIKEVSMNVFNAISPEYLTSVELIVGRDYIMKYIQKRTVLEYLSYIQNSVASQL